MSGGILTLAFEAPQAMRTLGITPLLALLAGLAWCWSSTDSSPCFRPSVNDRAHARR